MDTEPQRSVLTPAACDAPYENLSEWNLFATALPSACLSAPSTCDLAACNDYTQERLSISFRARRLVRRHLVLAVSAGQSCQVFWPRPKSRPSRRHVARYSMLCLAKRLVRNLYLGRRAARRVREVASSSSRSLRARFAQTSQLPRAEPTSARLSRQRDVLLPRHAARDSSTRRHGENLGSVTRLLGSRSGAAYPSASTWSTRMTSRRTFLPCALVLDPTALVPP